MNMMKTRVVQNAVYARIFAPLSFFENLPQKNMFERFPVLKKFFAFTCNSQLKLMTFAGFSQKLGIFECTKLLNGLTDFNLLWIKTVAFFISYKLRIKTISVSIDLVSYFRLESKHPEKSQKVAFCFYFETTKLPNDSIDFKELYTKIVAF